MNDSLPENPMQFGRYALGQPLTAHPSARKLSFLAGVFSRKKGRGETLYNCDRADFAGESWNIVIGVSHDRVRAITATMGSGRTKSTMEMAMGISIHCLQEKFGYNSREGPKGSVLWETQFGAVSLSGVSVRPAGGKELWSITVEMTSL